MEIISNQFNQNHQKVINRLIKQSDEIIICVAFLKLSGLHSILENLKLKKGKCNFFIGTDYFQTEPNAIRKLLYQGHTVFRVQKAKSTFHPKIYYFRKGNKVSILTGSANMTCGGLESNFEISVLIETLTNSAIDISFKSTINGYSRYAIDFDDEILISQYESDFDKYQTKHKKADKEFNTELANSHKLDFSKVSKYVKEYKSDLGRASNFNYRTKQYKLANSLIHQIAKETITSPRAFLEYYDKITKLFYSSGITRGKKTYAKKYKTILSIFKIVLNNKNIEAKTLFDKILPLSKSVKGYGINSLTELMSAVNSEKYSVANGRIIKSLSQLNFPKFPPQNNFNSDTYERFNNLILAIAVKCKFKSIGQVDHFLSWYYEKYITKTKKS